jgi:hypothetical protein
MDETVAGAGTTGAAETSPLTSPQLDQEPTTDDYVAAWEAVCCRPQDKPPGIYPTIEPPRRDLDQWSDAFLALGKLLKYQRPADPVAKLKETAEIRFPPATVADVVAILRLAEQRDTPGLRSRLTAAEQLVGPDWLTFCDCLHVFHWHALQLWSIVMHQREWTNATPEQRKEAQEILRILDDAMERSNATEPNSHRSGGQSATAGPPDDDSRANQAVPHEALASAPSDNSAPSVLSMYTLGDLIRDLEGSERAYAQNKATADKKAAAGRLDAKWWYVQAAVLRWQPEPARMPGIERIELLCDEEAGGGVTVESVRRLRAKVCRKAGIAPNVADKLGLNAAADLLNDANKAQSQLASAGTPTSWSDISKCPNCGTTPPSWAQSARQYVCLNCGWKLITGKMVLPVAAPGAAPVVIQTHAGYWEPADNARPPERDATIVAATANSADDRPALQLVPTDDGAIGTEAPSVVRGTVNQRMLEILERQSEAIGWSAEDWAGKLGCSKSTVHGTDAWQKRIKPARALQKAEALENADRRNRSRER